VDEAVDEFRQAIRLRPDHAPSHVELARLLVLRRDYAAAIVSVDAALRIDPKNLEAQMIRASALIGMGKPGVARLFLLETLKQHPDSPDIHFQIGVALMSDRRFSEAEESFRKVFQLEPAAVRGIQGVAETFFARDEPERAVAAMQAEADKQPGWTDLQIAFGGVAIRAKRYDVAVSRFKAILEKADKPRADVWARLGESYRLQGDLENAVAALRKAREIEPADTRWIAALGMILDTAGRKQEAAEAYRATLQLDPKHGPVLNNLAYLLADNGGDLKEALELAQRARNLMPKVDEVTDTVGWIYIKANMADAAIQLFEAVVARNSTNPVFRFHLGMARAQKGDKAGALRELRRALTDQPAKADEDKIRHLIRSLEAPARP
jgi:tetratricopeptide (TPR) repeat protein